jgi:hypothetical protein
MSHWLDKVLLLLRAPTSDLKELAELAGDDPRTFYRGIALSDLEVDGQDLGGMEFGDDEGEPVANLARQDPFQRLAASITGTPRQEERVAIILDLILQDRLRGFEMLGEYQSSAKFESYAVREIRAAFFRPSSSNDEMAAASLVAKFFSYTFPMNRGRLLFCLAKHLAKYRIVNAEITDSLGKTASMSVEEYRSRIERLLADAK